MAGSPLSAYSRGDRSPEVVAAWRAYHADYSRRRRDGENVTVPVADVAAYVERLRAAGVNYATTAREAGLTTQSVLMIARGRRRRVKATTAAAIFAIPLDAVVIQAEADNLVPALYLGSLVVELERAYSQRDLCSFLGLARGGFKVCKIGDSVRARTARRVITLYRLLARAGRVPNEPLVALLNTVAE